MKSNYEWHLSDGKFLEGEYARQYLINKLRQYKVLMKSIDNVASIVSDTNHIGKMNSLLNTVLETEESLSLIQMQLEMLLDEMKIVLEDN